MSGQDAVEKTKTPAAHRGGRRNRSVHRNEDEVAQLAPEQLLQAAPVTDAAQSIEEEAFMRDESGEQADQDGQVGQVEREQDEREQVEQDEPILIRPMGVVEIGRAAELKQQFEAALASGRKMVLSLQDVTELDVTAVQLLWALRQAAGERLQWQGDLPAEVAVALAEADLDRFLAA